MVKYCYLLIITVILYNLGGFGAKLMHLCCEFIQQIQNLLTAFLLTLKIRGYDSLSLLRGGIKINLSKNLGKISNWGGGDENPQTISHIQFGNI